MIKKIAVFLISALFLTVSFSHIVGATDSPLNIYLFWGDGCPHCAKEKAYFEEILPSYPSVTLHKYEIYHNTDNVELMKQVAKELNADASGVPFLIIGDQEIIGYADGITNKAIKDRLDYCINNQCSDNVADIVGVDGGSSGEKIIDNSNFDKVSVDLPFVGTINAMDFSLPVLTVIIGAIDGFNPCAMWVLILLISLLFGLNSRRRMWILGLTFIGTSAFVYFLFMIAWLQLVQFISWISWIKIVIGIVALAGGVYGLHKGIKSNGDGGCDVSGSEQRNKTVEKLQRIVHSKSFWLSLIGIIALAFSINLVEMVCSAGLPAIYTQVLTLSSLSPVQYYAYILLYILFFMIDDIIVFVVAMTTLRLTGISTKYSRYSNIIGGIIMLILGVLLIFKPEWLMFG